MSKSVIGARLIHRLSMVSGVTPTIPPNDDHTTGWVATDIYKAELFINMNDDRAWTRTNSGITEFVMTDRLTNKVPVSRMANQISGNFYISSGLTVGTLSGIGLGLRPIFASEDGMLITGAGVSGSGTVTQLLAGLGLISAPTTGITTSGTIQMGTPNDITSTSTNSFPGNTGHTHKFVPAGSTTEIQINSGNSLSSSSNFKYDGTDLYVMGMTNSGTSYVLCYNISNGKITYNNGSVVAGSSTEIQYNSGGTMYASSNFKYDGTDLYVVGMTQTGTSYLVFYNNSTGRFSYELSTAGTVSSITAGNGLSGGTITTNGTISMGTPYDITESTTGTLFSDGHDHRIKLIDGTVGSILYKTLTSGLTSNSNFKYVGNDLYVIGMTLSSTTYSIFYNSTSGRLTYGTANNGTVTSVLAGSGMTFTNITTNGYVTLGTPSNVTSTSTNNVNGSTHTHAFVPAGDTSCIQYNYNGTLSGSTNFRYDGINIFVSGITQSGTSYIIYYDNVTGKFTYDLKSTSTIGGSNTSVQYNSGNTFTGNNNFTYDGIDLYISGMTSNVTTDVVYYDSNTGRLTYGVKPSGGSGTTFPTGSTTFDIETKSIDSYLTSSCRFTIYNYVIYSGNTNSRAGTITVVNNLLTDSRISESSTNDIGNTSSVTFNVTNNGTNVDLTVTSTTSGWTCEWVKITK